MKLELQNLLGAQPILGEERLLKIAQTIDIGFSLILWCTYLLAILASFQHVAWAFSLLEEENQKWVGYLAAAAVDGALAVMAYTIQQRRCQRRVNWEMSEAEAEGTQALWIGLIFLGGISVIANFLHGIHVELHTGTLTLHHLLQMDALQWVRLVTNAIALPLIVVYLGEVVSVPGAGGVITNLLRSNKTLQRDLTAGQAEISELEVAVSSVTAEREQCQAALNQLRTTLAQAQGVLHKTQAELNTVSQRLHSQEAELKQTRTALNEAENECHRQQQIRHRQSTELETTHDDLRQAQSDLHKHTEGLHRLQTELDQKNTELAQLNRLIAAMNIPAQEAAHYLAHRANGVNDSQELAAQRAGERLGTPVSRDVIGRIARLIQIDEEES